MSNSDSLGVSKRHHEHSLTGSQTQDAKQQGREAWKANLKKRKESELTEMETLFFKQMSVPDLKRAYTLYSSSNTKPGLFTSESSPSLLSSPKDHLEGVSVDPTPLGNLESDQMVSGGSLSTSCIATDEASPDLDLATTLCAMAQQKHPRQLHRKHRLKSERKLELDRLEYDFLLSSLRTRQLLALAQRYGFYDFILENQTDPDESVIIGKELLVARLCTTLHQSHPST